MHGLFRWSSKWWPGVIPLVIFWAIAAWTSTATAGSRSGRAHRPPRSRIPFSTRRRIAVAGRDVTLCGGCILRKTAVAARLASVEAVPGVRLVNDETQPRSRSQAVRLVGRARRRPGDAAAAARRCRPSKGRLLEAARAQSRRRRGRRPDEFVARRAAALRQRGACCCSTRSAS